MAPGAAPALGSGLMTLAIRSGLGAAPVAVLGQTMDRVKNAAGQLGAKRFETTVTSFDDMMAANRSWIQLQIRRGATLFDIGENPRALTDSPFYKMEIEQLILAGYQRLFERLIMIDGEIVQLYKWVPKGGGK